MKQGFSNATRGFTRTRNLEICFGQEWPEIYSSHSLEIQRVNSLTAFLGWSGIQDDSVIKMAIEFALQQDRIHTSHYFLGFKNYYRVLAAMLCDLPSEGVRGYLHPVLESHRSRKNALTLLALIGDQDDIATVAPYLGHDDPWTVRLAMSALGYLEDCTQLPDIRRIAFDSDALSLMRPLAVNVLGRCGRASDLDSLFEMMPHIENVDFEGGLRKGVLNAMSIILQRQKDSSQQHRFLDLSRELLNAPHAALRLKSADALSGRLSPRATPGDPRETLLRAATPVLFLQRRDGPEATKDSGGIEPAGAPACESQ